MDHPRAWSVRMIRSEVAEAVVRASVREGARVAA